MRFVRPFVVVVGFAAVTACSGSDAPTAPAGFFPPVFSGQGFVSNAHLVKAAAVDADRRSLHFHPVIPRPGGWALVARCDRGRLEVDFGGSTTGGPCRGTSGVVAGCAGGLDKELTVTVSAAQTSRWGIAIYRSRCPAEGPDARRAKASPTPR